ncbi:MAG: hypothetical protein ACRELY_27080 [Polyangiaceae bacterium]
MRFAASSSRRLVMRSLASIAFGITFTILLMLLAAFNKKKSPRPASREPLRRSPRENEAFRANREVLSDDEPAHGEGSVLAFRRRPLDHGHAASHGHWRH